MFISQTLFHWFSLDYHIVRQGRSQGCQEGAIAASPLQNFRSHTSLLYDFAPFESLKVENTIQV